MSVSSLLLLADGRFPDGTHAHSFGLESAVAAGRVHDVGSLGEYTTSRLWTTGRTDAATARLAAAGHDADRLDGAWCVRTPSAVARASARALGRSLVRTAARVVPGHPLVLADGRPPVQPVAFGRLAQAVGCDPDEAAVASAHGAAATLTAAGLRLLCLDPFDVAALLADLRSEIDGVAASVGHLDRTDDLPHASAPFSEIDLEVQATLPTRLFRS